MEPSSSPPPGVLDADRLNALHQTGLLSSVAEPAFDRITHLAARVLGAPIALVSLVTSVSLVTGDRQFFKSGLGLPPPMETCRQSPLLHSFCQHVVGSGQTLAVPHAANDPVFGSSGVETEREISAYLGVPLRSESGHVLGAFCVADFAPRNWTSDDAARTCDFAALVETEIRLRAFQTQLQAAREQHEQNAARLTEITKITEAFPIGVFVTDAAGACRYTNPKLREIAAVPDASGLLGDGLFCTIHVADRERVLRRWQAALRGKNDFFSVHRLARRDLTGAEVWVSVKAAPRQSGWAGTLEDISDRKAADDALVETCRFIHQITETVPLLITVTDATEHQSVYANREFTNALGCSAAEAAQNAPSSAHDPSFLRAKMHPNDLPGYLDHMEQVLCQQAGDAPLTCQYRVQHAQDGAWRWFRSRDTVFERSKQTGEPTHFLSIAEDITPAKHHEESLLALTRQLQKSNAALQEFASVASHDLQEPLRKVQTFGDRLKKRCADALDEDGTDYLNRMLAASARMQVLIDDLLLYSRVSSQAQTMRQTDLNDVIQGVLADLETRLQQTGGVVEVEPLPRIAADPTQMRQLLQNLIGNALKFHKPGIAPQVRVSTQKVEQNPDGGDTMYGNTTYGDTMYGNTTYGDTTYGDTTYGDTTYGDTTYGDTVYKESRAFCRISVQDNGIGFEKQYAERIFDVFERLHTRADYEGTGMGLAICRKIVQRHGGTIAAESSPEKGTQIVVTLPKTQEIQEIQAGEPNDLIKGSRAL